jgi:beta-fructofuranosidase
LRRASSEVYHWSVLSVPRHHLGDSWYCADGDRFHCFFLVCPDTVPRHTGWDIGHASSDDLKTWTYHGVVVRRGAADACDGICLATGSVLRRGGRFWMAYTGNWFGPQPTVGLAVSTDLHHWRKVDENPITKIDEVYYTGSSRGRRPFPHWRDPFLFEVDGVVHQLVCATAKGRDGAAGSLGVARSLDLRAWEILPPLDVEPFAEELECPQVVSVGERHYLVFSTPAGLLLSDDRPAPDEVGNMYCMVGDSPFGPFRVADPTPLFPADMTQRPYAGRVVQVGSHHYLLGTLWSDSGDRISDPVRIELTPRGIRAAL